MANITRHTLPSAARSMPRPIGKKRKRVACASSNRARCQFLPIWQNFSKQNLVNWKQKKEVIKMAENVKIIETSRVDSLKNPELRTAARKVVKLEQTRERAAYAIAQVLYNVDLKRLYVQDGFKSIEQFANSVFGYKRATVNNMMRIAKNYMLPDGSGTVLQKDGQDFTYSKLSELLPLDAEIVKQAVEDGEITPAMTQRELREYVKNQKNPKATEEHETPEVSATNAAGSVGGETTAAAETPNAANGKMKMFAVMVRRGDGEYIKVNDWNNTTPFADYIKNTVFTESDEIVKVIVKVTDVKYFIESDKRIYGVCFSSPIDE